MDNATRIISSLYNLWYGYFGDLNVTRYGPAIDQTMLATLVFLFAFQPCGPILPDRRPAPEAGRKDGKSY
ncbi:MAG TPA: hypothetical protein PLM07_03740 [Candidatus Rifleibacterium sp.]|nr:hypothetical protein [Candidatus Rifleibacterium sp.]HPT44997.1 hypothetical protein [Candidatus Rifleibacterium sp.]